jgi:hypothetical protein
MRNILNFEAKIHDRTKVLVVNPVNTYWSYQLTSEIALRAREKSENVFWLNVGPRQKSKYEINKHDNVSSLKFKNPEEMLEGILLKSGIRVMKNSCRAKRPLKTTNFQHVSELRSYTLEGLNIGAIIFSAIASAKQTTSFDIRDVRNYVRHFMASSVLIRDQIESAISLVNPDLILSINDRLIGSSLSLALAKKNKVESSVIYWGSNSNSIEDYRVSLYDSSEWQEKILENWQVNPPDKIALENLKKETLSLATDPSKDSRQYLHLQNMGMTIDKRRKTCVFYAQSEHEHSPNFITQTRGRFQNQYQAFSALQEVAIEFGYDLVLKFHPYKGKNGYVNLTRKLHNLDWKSVQIDPRVIQISPDSSIDTYALMNDAEINVIWSSTVGLESIARQKPVLVLGRPHWLDLSWGIHAWNHEELRDSFKREFFHLEESKLYPWFWYLRNYGSEMRYSSIDCSMLSIKGEEIFLPTVFYRISKLLRRLNIRQTQE